MFSRFFLTRYLSSLVPASGTVSRWKKEALHKCAKCAPSSFLHFAPVIGAALTLLLPSIGSSATVAIYGVSEIRTSTGTTLNDGSLVWVGTFGAKTDATIQGYFNGSNTLTNLQSNFSIFGTGSINKSSEFSFPTASGTGATGTATISGGRVTSITFSSSGIGYNTGTKINLLGGGGTGASADLVLDVSGRITGVTNLIGGSGYAYAPRVELANSTSELATLNYNSTTEATFLNQVVYALVFKSATEVSSDEVALFRFVPTFLGNDVPGPELELSPLGVEILFGTTYSTNGDGQFRMGSLNQATGITSTLTASATRNSPFTYTITANNGPTSFFATYNGGALPTGLTLNSATGVISGTPIATADTYNIQLTSIGPLGSVTATLALTINNPVGGTPSISSSLASQSTVAGVAYAGYTITANNSPTSYSAVGLPAGMSCDAGTGVISGTPTQTGPFTVIISATNGSGTGSSSFSLNVTAPTVSFANKIFTVNSAGTTTAPTVTAGFTPTYTIKTGTLPDGLNLDSSTGIISGTPTTYGTKTLTIRAIESGVTADSDPFTLTVNTTPPTLNSGTSVAGYVGTEITYNLTTISSPSVAPVDSYSIVSSSDPSAVPLSALNQNTGVFTFTPSRSGLYTAQFRANNGITAGAFGGGLSLILTVTFTIEVNPPTFRDGISAAEHVTVAGKDYVSIPLYIGRKFGHPQVGATSAFFSAVPGLPWPSPIIREGSGLTETITFRPTQAGTYGIRRNISNSSRNGSTQAATRDLIITVIDQLPTLTGSGFVPPPSGKVGQAYRQYVTSSGANRSAADPISFNATGLPLGLSFKSSAADRQMGLLTGTPTKAGTYSVKFYIANPKGSIVQSVTMTIEP
jgi:hypothetical protein